MSFLDNLFGGGAKKRDLSAANASATAALNQSRERQLAALSGATGTARQDLNAGYDQARTDLTGGYDRARGDFTTQYGRAEDAINAGMGRARDALNPMISLGANYDRMYADALGANGTDARTAFYDQNVRGNTDFAYADELAAKQLQAKLNASGITGGRAGSLALRQGAARIEDRTNQYLDRIRAAGDRGAAFSGQLAGLEANAGTQTAGIRQGLGDRLGGAEINRGTALAGNETARGTSQANFGMDTARAISGVEGGYGTATASNAINFGNAMAATRGQGMNAMIDLAGLGIRAATPGIGGTSAIGNIQNGMRGLTTPKVGQWQTSVVR